MGVINEPEIQWFDITKEDMFLVMATDGFWDLLYSTQTCYYIEKFLRTNEIKKQKVAQFLVHKGLKKALKFDDKKSKFKNSNILYDDITIIIALIDNW